MARSSEPPPDRYIDGRPEREQAPRQAINTISGVTFASTRARASARLGPLRVAVVALALSLVAAIAFATQVLILDAPPWTPHARVIVETNEVLKPTLLAVGAAWVISWLPLISLRARVVLLRACIVLLMLAGPAWVLAVLIRLRFAGA